VTGDDDVNVLRKWNQKAKKWTILVILVENIQKTKREEKMIRV
jgi:hypothetical protein